MDQKAGAQISQRAFLQSLAILFLLMMIAVFLGIEGVDNLLSYSLKSFGGL